MRTIVRGGHHRGVVVVSGMIKKIKNDNGIATVRLGHHGPSMVVAIIDIFWIFVMTFLLVF